MVNGQLLGLAANLNRFPIGSILAAGLYFVEKGANQRGSTVIYDRENSAVSLALAAEYDFAKALEGVHWLHITGITPSISEQACEANLALVQQAKQAGVTVSCDLNFRKKLWRWRSTVEPKQLARDCMAEVLWNWRPIVCTSMTSMLAS